MKATWTMIHEMSKPVPVKRVTSKDDSGAVVYCWIPGGYPWNDREDDKWIDVVW